MPLFLPRCLILVWPWTRNWPLSMWEEYNFWRVPKMSFIRAQIHTYIQHVKRSFSTRFAQYTVLTWIHIYYLSALKQLGHNQTDCPIKNSRILSVFLKIYWTLDFNNPNLWIVTQKVLIAWFRASVQTDWRTVICTLGQVAAYGICSFVDALSSVEGLFKISYLNHQIFWTRIPVHAALRTIKQELQTCHLSFGLHSLVSSGMSDALLGKVMKKSVLSIRLTGTIGNHLDSQI